MLDLPGRRSSRSPDEAADFSALYGQHALALVRFFARRTFDSQLALDLMAETFAQALLSRGSTRGRSDEERAAWLYAIARGQLDRYYRRGRAERNSLERLGLQVPRPDVAEFERIEELVDFEVSRRQIRDALAELSGDQRDAVELRIVQELDYIEVAMLLGISEPTALARVSRGLRALADTLDALPYREETVS